MVGTVKSYSPWKHYGFIKCDEIPSNIFFHAGSIKKSAENPHHIGEGDLVSFTLDDRNKERPRAEDVELIN